MDQVRIYKPARNAMQSGRANTQKWVLEYAPSKKQTDSLMGWTGAGDTRNQVKLNFESKEEAVAFAEKHRLTYVVQEPHERKIKPKSYAANFAYHRPPLTS